MSKDSVLKKEFKKADVERARNLIKKDYTAGTKQQIGYKKTTKVRREGDIWEDGGKKWTVKNGIIQNITKLDEIKKAVRIPLVCPKCKGSMKHHLAKKMYKIHGFCFDCTINYEASLRKAGLYEQYEKRMMQGNMKAFAKDIEDWAMDLVVGFGEGYVTEQGDVEDWKSNSNINEQLLKGIKEYTDHLRNYLT